MNAITLQPDPENKGAFVPTPTTLPDPEPGAGEILVRVRAVSLNYRDLMIARGEAGLKNLEGLVPASDGAGEVVAVGDGVSRFKTGDRVAGTFFQGWHDGRFEHAYHAGALGGTASGMMAELVVLDEGGAVAIPDHLSFEEAATLPCAAVTAWHSLVGRGQLQAGQTVLCLGTGGVSIFGLQIAAAFGAEVVITSSSDEKLERARALGATHLINYRTNPDWDEEVRKLTSKRGVDHVIEVGGGGTLQKSLNSAAASGSIALVGVLTGFGGPDGGLFPLVTRNASIHGIYVGSRAHFEALNSFLSKHKLHPVIDCSFALKDAAQAYAYQASGAHLGKIVVTCE